MDNIERIQEIHREIVKLALDRRNNPDGYTEMILEQFVQDRSKTAWETCLLEMPSNRFRTLLEELKAIVPKKALRKELEAILKEVILKKLTSKSLYVTNLEISNIASFFTDWPWVTEYINLLDSRGRKFALMCLVWNPMPKTNNNLRQMKRKYYTLPQAIDGWVENLALVLGNHEYDSQTENQVWTLIKKEVRKSC